MSQSWTNAQIAALLRKIAAAYLILGENRFTIIAYERAADNIANLTSEITEYWKRGKLDEIPGVGKALASHLHELLSSGKSTLWEEILAKLPNAVFPLLLVPGIGPKRAFVLVKELKLKNAETVVEDLEKASKADKVAKIERFGEKSQNAILDAIAAYKRGQIKENRMPLPLADEIAQKVIEHIQASGKVTRIDVLGSLRRKVATIGDIDIAAATDHPQEVVARFLNYPHERKIDQGEKGATILLHNGRQVDLRVQKPEAYGAMLQYFTGSRNHNIRLREYALKSGLSLNEHGIKNLKTGQLKEYASEKEFYEAVGLQYIAPEMREDRGEIELAAKRKLPKLLELGDIRGDLHIHSDYDLKSSHDTGANTIAELLERARQLNYEYIGFSDHNPKSSLEKEEVVEIMAARYQHYQKEYVSWKKKHKDRVPKMFVMCEIDIRPDGTPALPLEAFDYLDAAIVSVHSSFTMPLEKMTSRIIQAITYHPKIKILGHPTGRLLGKRESITADWRQIMDVIKEREMAMEVNAYPDRLDLPDNLVFEAVKQQVKLCVDTDSHALDNMDLMRYGVAVARRGWAEQKDVVNCMGANAFAKWILNI